MGGFNLLAPTYEVSARIAAALDPGIKVDDGPRLSGVVVHADDRDHGCLLGLGFRWWGEPVGGGAPGGWPGRCRE